MCRVTPDTAFYVQAILYCSKYLKLKLNGLSHMSKTVTWIATAVTLAVPMTLLFCKLNSKRKENIVNIRYSTDDILFDI
jgi:hypothetical protein